MVIAIQLDRQASARTVEVEHVRANGMLPSEGGAELIVAKRIPGFRSMGDIRLRRSRARAVMAVVREKRDCGLGMRRPPPGSRTSAREPTSPFQGEE
jgi:hypothetical protein